MKRFIKMYYSLLECNETTLSQKIVLSLIISYHEGGKEFYMTNDCISEQLKYEVKSNTIRAMIPDLEEMGFITTQKIKYKNDVNGWVNKRYIRLTDKTLTIINSETDEETPQLEEENPVPVIEQNVIEPILESVIEIDENIEDIILETEIEEPIQKLKGEEELDAEIENLEKLYVADDFFKEKIPFIKSCSFDGEQYCLKRFEKRIRENRGKFIKRKAPSAVI